MLDMNFNIRSGPQMQEFLYEYLGLKPLKEKNDKGNYSVSEEVLTHYAEKENNEFCRLILNYRKLFKAGNTYVKGIKKNISELDHCIHPDFWLNIAETFRSSSSNINFQNIPKHGDIIPGIPWQWIRKIFVALKAFDTFHYAYGKIIQPGFFLGEVDYVGAEVKACAGITDDAQLICDLNNDLDTHSHWANEIFGLNKELHEIKQLYKDERFLAKNNFTFANLFGAGAFSIAEEFRKSDVYKNHVLKAFKRSQQIKGFNTPWEQFFIKFSEEHIQECQNIFYARYPDVKNWQDYVVKHYYEVGYVENPFGFRRRYPLKRNEIINYPIQSTSFHLLLHSLLIVEDKMRERDLRSTMAGQIHDSGYFNIKFEEAEEVMDLVEYEMTHKDFEWIKKVKLEAEWELGENWNDLKLDNKWFVAKHIPSGQEFKQKTLHWFAQDMHMKPKRIIDVLNKKKDKDEKLITIPNWEFQYAS